MKSIVKIGIFCLLLGVVASPFVLWFLTPSTKMGILIIDKTVPDQTYREHLGLTWALNHLKIKKDDGTNYQLHEDYVGYHPAADGSHTIKGYPEGEKHDFIYVADGYGVYSEDLTTGNPEGERSELIYGGMTLEDVTYIKQQLYEHGSTLIGEFNTFGSPTPDDVKESFYEMYNLTWTGWIGRYFEDLSNEEVPVWAKKNYENQYNNEWSFTGKGVVFVDDTDKIVVLEVEEMEESSVRFTFTEKGQDVFDSHEEALYQYWFDVIIPKDDTEVLASFSLSLTKEAEAKLEENDIPAVFPAVIHHQNATFESYYFAGDFADQSDLPSLYQAYGLPTWKKWQASKNTAEAFYWRIYHPMLKTVLMKEKSEHIAKEAPQPVVSSDGNSRLAGMVGSTYLQVNKDGEWEDFLIKGVNMGIAKPGTWPGETAITKEEYSRWFQYIGDMNANAIRIYTIHPPSFYEALAEYNKLAKNPIYLFHGVWLNEEVFLETADAFDQENVEEFQKEIRKTVDLIHGNADIKEQPGHASGKYTADVSSYVLGWVLGVEWDPDVVLNTNEKHEGIPEYTGEYIYTEQAEPFETWLAEMMEYTISYELENYQWQRPMSFTNWVTTDLLTHSDEPSEKEDMVSVNPNLIHAQDTFESGIFASYHIYPYYPDFLNFEERYVNYVDHRGEKNNYAGYLQHMKEVHEMPLLVAEFGIPASRGKTHHNVYGWNQGGNTEKEQGAYITHLFEDIVEEEMAGGLIFSWQDEWFKRTWNTMDFDNPNQRPHWKNVQTNEQMFGLLTFDPGTEPIITIDGRKGDWEKLSSGSVYNPSSIITGMQVAHDEGYLYVKMDAPIEDNEYKILFNILENQGQATVPSTSNYQTEGIDFVLEVNGEDNSRLLVDSYYDTFYYMYAHQLQMIETHDYANTKNNGTFHPIRLTLNKELEIGGTRKVIPFESYETGILRHGNADPNAENADSLADFFLNKEEQFIEIRIPWALLNIKDPSHLEAMGDVWSEGGLENSEFIDGIRIGAIAVSDGEVIDSLPAMVGDTAKSADYYLYQWQKWEQPTYHERLKESYFMIQELFELLKVR
ncbi:hypothetical protein [Sutcliffiella rhizosphaerae]|uniref:Family 2 glycosyl transferase n=1 Tax=Sutcliffiella rhizosphaerae TaxID=2880967 RepID=A0ABN8ADL4_9BACI|nr:hypothetical protein [Sutcliffiella rhizosphaerae]CAG9621258.1 hypothetical protein BACCIP111883_02030 [Sutcliffiella rhizosphaerae]